MSNENTPYIFKMPAGRKPTFPIHFKTDDLVIAYKIDKIQYDNIIRDLKTKTDQKIINSLVNEAGDLKEGN